KRTDCSASLSRCGVLILGLPLQPRSPYPWSSVRMTRTFGRRAGGSAAAAGSVTAAPRRERRTACRIGGLHREKGTATTPWGRLPACQYRQAGSLPHKLGAGGVFALQPPHLFADHLLHLAAGDVDGGDLHAEPAGHVLGGLALQGGEPERLPGVRLDPLAHP